MEVLSLLAGTVILRPYVFIFLALYLLVASSQLGWRRALLWTVTGYAVAFAAEFSSIHGGFPFGDYFYIDATRNRELWIAGVPFMDSLSFSFLTYTGYACAWQIAAALKSRSNPQDAVTYQSIRRSRRVLILGAAITTLMDIIIDPVALMGDRWFLGQIHGWPRGGQYFGVPFTNFAGWFLVAAVTIGVNQALDALLNRSGRENSKPPLPYMHLGGFALFLFITGFNLCVTAWLREWRLFFSGLVLTVAFLFAVRRILAKGGFFLPYPAVSPGTSRLHGYLPPATE